MSTIVLIRPGYTDFDDQQRIQGALDIPLNAAGVRQIQQIAKDLHDAPLDLFYSGPQSSARETAALMAKDRGLCAKVLDGLHNVNCGLWQGLRVEDIRRKHHKIFKLCHEFPATVCPPEGETLAEAAERVHQALAKPLRKGLNFAIVAPEPIASVIRCVIQKVNVDHVCWLPCSTAGDWEFLETSTTALESPSGLLRRFARPAHPVQADADVHETAVIVTGTIPAEPVRHASDDSTDSHDYGREPGQRLVKQRS